REACAGDGRQAAADDGVGAVVAARDVVEVHGAAVAVRAAFDLAVQLGHHAPRLRAAREGVAVRTVRRREDVAVRHRLADTDRDGLLADRDVQEPGQLARTEALLHLLLEAADEQHLREEVLQRLVVQRRRLLDLGHRPAVYVLRVALAQQWRDLEAGLAPGWGHVQLQLT